MLRATGSAEEPREKVEARLDVEVKRGGALLGRDVEGGGGGAVPFGIGGGGGIEDGGGGRGALNVGNGGALAAVPDETLKKPPFFFSIAGGVEAASAALSALIFGCTLVETPAPPGKALPLPPAALSILSSSFCSLRFSFSLRLSTSA
jgi:hypothetical protein